MADRLPREIILLILANLDPFAYRSAGQVCRSWRNDTQDFLTLRQQLAKLPVVTPHWPSRIDPATLHSIWLQSVTDLMLNARLRTSSELRPHSLPARENKFAYSADLRRIISLNARILTLYSESSQHNGGRTILSQALLNDVRSKTRQGPILRNAPSCVFEVAIASHSNLVAVALDRIVQIYDLDRPNETPAAAFLGAAAGHFITGVSFESNDDMLRICLSNKGVVLYLGMPRTAYEMGPASLEHWKSEQGLMHVSLNSTQLSVAGRPNERLACMQLLYRESHGWVAAAQTHSPMASVGYILAFVPDQIADSNEQIRLMTVLSDLAMSHHDADMSSHFWSIAAQGKEQVRPRYCLSLDRKLLAVVEEGSGHFTPAQSKNRTFAWRLPSDLTAESHAVSPSSSHPVIHNSTQVSRLPLYLGEADGIVLSMSIAQNGSAEHQITLDTTNTTTKFLLEGV